MVVMSPVTKDCDNYSCLSVHHDSHDTCSVGLTIKKENPWNLHYPVFALGHDCANKHKFKSCTQTENTHTEMPLVFVITDHPWWSDVSLIDGLQQNHGATTPHFYRAMVTVLLLSTSQCFCLLLRHFPTGCESSQQIYKTAKYNIFSTEQSITSIIYSGEGSTVRYDRCHQSRELNQYETKTLGAMTFQ